MDFHFIGGSISTAVGEKISRSVDYCLEHKLPLIIITRSGGARLMEGNFSLMQMVRVGAKLSELAKHKLPFYSLLTDPTIGAATSMALQADVVMAEPDALIGNASPKVIMESIGRDLPKGFQRSEYLLEHGFVDMIVDRRELKTTLGCLLSLIQVG
jgi:acetyl-CoA carboxylase carboxyl transferase subunit beta